MTAGGKRFVITVLIADRVGILRDITAAVTGLDGEIDGISQTVVAGYFTVILTATFRARTGPEDIRRAVGAHLGPDEADVAVRSYRQAPPAPAVGDRYVITIYGARRRYALKTVTAFLAEKGVNIEDWHVRFHDAAVVHIGEVTVPRVLDIKQLQSDFRQVLDGLDMDGTVQHENIFRATSDVGPIDALLREPHP